MNNNPAVMTDEQYEFCKEQSNILAKMIMDLNPSPFFEKDKNAVFVLETLVILIAGTLSVISKRINVDVTTILTAFHGQVERTIEAHEKKPFLKLVH